MLLLTGRELPPQEPPIVHWLKKGYHQILLGVEKIPWLVMAVVALFVALGVGGLFFLSESFLPELREGNITIHMIAVPGTSLEESLRLGDRITESVLEIPSEQSVAQRAGRAELGTDTMGTHESEIDVNLKARDGNQVKACQHQDKREPISSV